MDYTPNYKNYSLNELLDAQKYIDKDSFPQRAQELELEIANKIKDPEIKAEFEELETNKRYATFWPRFWAAIIDGLIFTALLYIECLLFGVEYSNQNMVLQAVNGVQYIGYVVFMHGFYGQTLGKMVMDVKVLDHDTETDINLKQSVRRESVNIAINSSWILLLLSISISLQQLGSIHEFLTYLIMGLSSLATVWALSEFITMLFNEKRRAIHDFIGKTVVVRL
ncbi:MULTISPECIES: RDD family protein [unclassified Pseudoalteromonas]|uniref:RDD family protein n=1 Tax=unclassified Pseudoalteromonas TaxID=194690 RepID=UPI00110AB9B0|nr:MULTISPECIES: RDD family protein [unclassified Pseudoalteromonas]TMP46011.1 RDD family protein [Pseudoalteromonas sp. S1650]TMP64683.1 RDD family protein [Pseudoalteromonas sp. S1649]